MESLTNVDKTMDLISASKTVGITVAEVRRSLRIHHGTASSVLSNLHKDGVIMRLSEKRGSYKIYVLPDYVVKRNTERQGRLKNCPHCGEDL
jgi:predicted transcriptional regulator of viral defense system